MPLGENIRRFGRILASILRVVVGSFFVLAALAVFFDLFGGFDWLSRRTHAKEIEAAFRNELLPAAAFMRSFLEREHRLPSDSEMREYGWNIGPLEWGTYHVISIERAGLRGTNSWGVEGRDFRLATLVPDWNLYYCSWDNKRIESRLP
jgi:hypothetical protein